MSAAGKIPGLEDVETRPAGVLDVSRPDLVALALLALAHLTALGVIGWLVLGHVNVVRSTRELQARLRGVTDVDGRLALLEKQIAVQDAELGMLKLRVSPDVRPSAIADRIEFKAKELNIALQPVMLSEGQLAAIPLGGAGEKVELRRFDRTIDARGNFRDVSALVAELESWPELVGIRTLSIRRGGKGSETLAHVETSVYQAVQPSASGGRP